MTRRPKCPGWNRIFSSTTLPTIETSQEQVLVTCPDLAVVVCREETSLAIHSNRGDTTWPLESLGPRPDMYIL